MGVAGAALSTTIGNGLEMTNLMLWSQIKKAPTRLGKITFQWSRKFLSSIIITCAPVILNELFWSLGMVMYKIAYSRMGMDVVASVNVTEAITNLFLVAARAINIGASIIIGIKIGEGKIETSHLYARRFLIVGFSIGILMGILLAASSPFVPLIFNVSPEIRTMTSRSLLAISLLMPIKGITGTFIVGILRSGGDTRFSMFTEMGSVWLIGVPCAFLGALVLKWDIWYVYLLIGLEEVAKSVVSAIRVRSGKWLNDVTKLTGNDVYPESLIDAESTSYV